VDVAATASIHRYARESADAGAGVIVASSDEEELCDICDRVLVLRDGEIVGELVGDEISQERILQLHR
jgi:ABC-type sugar transport system ATPase subunit